MSRKIFERQIVDVETGEIVRTTSEYVRKNTETFFMGRTTEGIEWLLNFKNLTEVQLLILMLELENKNNKNIITFTKLQLEETSKILNVAEITIKKCIQSLINNDFLVRVTRSNYIANPLTFYKGGTVELKSKLVAYNSCKIRIDSKVGITDL